MPPCVINLKFSLLYFFIIRLPQYVTVQGVRCEPQEDGVVCGSLTLGPSFNKDKEATSNDRTAVSNILKQQAFSKV